MAQMGADKNKSKNLRTSAKSADSVSGPPNALECPKTMSSMSTITTLGAPYGAFTSTRT
jgi:hypothetical protein